MTIKSMDMICETARVEHFTAFIIVLLQNKNSEFCAPLTSFDWNETDPNILGASSIDTTCTVWGLEVKSV